MMTHIPPPKISVPAYTPFHCPIGYLLLEWLFERRLPQGNEWLILNVRRDQKITTLYIARIMPERALKTNKFYRFCFVILVRVLWLCLRKEIEAQLTNIVPSMAYG